MRPAIGGGLDLAVAGDGILISTFLCTNSHKKWTKKRGAAQYLFHSPSKCPFWISPAKVATVPMSQLSTASNRRMKNRVFVSVN